MIENVVDTVGQNFQEKAYESGCGALTEADLLFVEVYVNGLRT
jgi:hypothetical protein